ncbi:hypothetical protein SPD79_04535 [Oceanobacillus sp. SE10311]
MPRKWITKPVKQKLENLGKHYIFVPMEVRKAKVKRTLERPYERKFHVRFDEGNGKKNCPLVWLSKVESPEP